MKNSIVVNFKNIISELKTKDLKLCFLNGKDISFIDSQNNMYQMELCRQGSYLDKLIKDGITVEFNHIDVKDYAGEIWDVLEVKKFIKRQKHQRF